MLNHPTLDKLETLRFSGMVKALTEQMEVPDIEDPVVIRKILAHLSEKATPAGRRMLPECRAPSHRVCEDWMSISGFSAEQIV